MYKINNAQGKMDKTILKYIILNMLDNTIPV